MKKGRETVATLLETMGEAAAKAARKALSEGADVVAEEARARCPVDSGALRESIHKDVKKGGGRINIVADAENNGVLYGRLVEFSPRINRPFLYPAMDAKRQAVRDHVTEAVRAALKRR